MNYKKGRLLSVEEVKELPVGTKVITATRKLGEEIREIRCSLMSGSETQRRIYVINGDGYYTMTDVKYDYANVYEYLEETKEPIKKVKCIDNAGCEKSLTKDKIYNVLEEYKYKFYIKDDTNIKHGYFKHRFEDVKEEFTFEEATARIKLNEEYICTEDDYRIKSITRTEYGIKLIYASSNTLNASLTINPCATFKLKDNYMTFLEAKEKGIPKHKDFFLGYLKSENNMKNFIEEMDKKVWYVE